MNIIVLEKIQCLIGYAALINCREIFTELKVPAIVDYLPIDIEPAGKTYIVLLVLPMDEHRLGVITNKHDRYVSGDKFVNFSREYLEAQGYNLIVPM